MGKKYPSVALMWEGRKVFMLDIVDSQFVRAAEYDRKEFAVAAWAMAHSCSGTIKKIPDYPNGTILFAELFQEHGGWAFQYPEEVLVRGKRMMDFGDIWGPYSGDFIEALNDHFDDVEDGALMEALAAKQIALRAASTKKPAVRLVVDNDEDDS